MDPTSCSLFLAMGAASSAAFISGWLLHMMVPEWLFWSVLLSSLAAAPIGLFAPWCCNRQQRQFSIVPTSNIFSATALSFLVGGGFLCIDRSANNLPGRPFITDDFVRTLIAVAGMGMAFSLVSFLLHYTVLQLSQDGRRMVRRVRKMSRWAPKAKLVYCADMDDLATRGPGECAICLDTLAEMEDDAACTHGLLKLPCGHLFHGSCADRWMTREVSCPMCRKPVGSLAHCERFVLRGAGDDVADRSNELDKSSLQKIAIGEPAEGAPDCIITVGVVEDDAGVDVQSVTEQDCNVECESEPGARIMPCSSVGKSGVTGGGVCAFSSPSCTIMCGPV